MHGFGFALIWFILIPLAVIVGTLILGGRLLSGLFSRAKREESADEARMVQEMYQAMSRLEERVEVLETLLLDAERRAKGGNDHV
ncbi:MAG: envelope stress response membrane protein PspB [Thermodesulfobacteriota bacterium]